MARTPRFTGPADSIGGGLFGSYVLGGRNPYGPPAGRANLPPFTEPTIYGRGIAGGGALVGPSYGSPGAGGGNVDFSSLANLLNSYTNLLGPDFLQSVLGMGGGAGNVLSGFYGGGRGGADIGGSYANVLKSLGGFANPSAGFLANNPLFGGLMGNLSYLNQYGLPGQQQLEGEMARLGLGGLAGGLLGGQGQYGVTDLLSQIMGQGLPGQRQIESMIPGQSILGNLLQGQAAGAYGNLLGYQPGIEQTAEKQIGAGLLGGGLTPEFVAAQRRQVLQPQLEALRGTLARSGLVDSGPRYELEQRAERDFADTLTQQGFQNYGQLLNQALGLGGEQFGRRMGIAGAQAGLGSDALNRALAAFGGVAGQAYPYINLAGGLGTNLLGQGLERYNVLGQRGLENLRTIGELGALPYQLGLQGAGAGADREMQLLSMLLGGAQGFLGGERQFGLGAAELPFGLLRSYLSGEQQKTIADLARQSQLSQANRGLLGQGIGAGGAILAALLGLSSRRFKENIISNINRKEALDRVMSISLARFNYKSGQKERLGWINEEAPNEFVEEGGLTIDVVSTLGHLVAAIQELTNELERTKAQVSALGQHRDLSS